MPIERPIIGALPRSEAMDVSFKIHGYNLTERGARVSSHSESVTLRELPEIICNIELWYGEYMIVSMPLAMGGGYWVWIPPTVPDDGETELDDEQFGETEPGSGVYE